ncbi:MAG TPA: hypothetical protein H9711_11780 [Candidatus Mediterraneibacter intestinavium]|nr:hypothetical protein [Candidatus Mediterraneibacter intestinavium]
MKQILGKRTAGVLLSAVLLFAAVLPAQAAGNAGVSVQIPVKQEFAASGNGAEEADGKISYLLTAREKDSPMPEGSSDGCWSFTMTGNQDIQTSPIEFGHAGVFSYEIRSAQDGQKDGYVYDDCVYTVSVYVSNTADGLAADLIAQNEDGDKVSEIIFSNSYSGGNGGGQLPGGQDTGNRGDSGQNDAGVKNTQIPTKADTGKDEAAKTGDSLDMLPVFGTALLFAAVVIVMLLWKRSEQESD